MILMETDVDLVKYLKSKASAHLILGKPIDDIENILTLCTQVNVDFQRKFDFLVVHNFLWFNYQKNINLCDFVQYIRIFIKFGTNLLQDEAKRHEKWRQISLKKRKWKQLHGWQEILQSFGYTEQNNNDKSLKIPLNSIPDQGRISEIVCELVLLCVELERAVDNEENSCQIENLFLVEPTDSENARILNEKIQIQDGGDISTKVLQEDNLSPETVLARSEQVITECEMVLKRTDARGLHDGQHCDLCGCSAPAVRCEKCSLQIFCLSCDDMYHRHPKRKSHVRKALIPCSKTPVKSLPNEIEANPHRLPVPPPRKKKNQQKSVPSSPLFTRKSNENPPLPKKEFSFMDKVGSLRRMMIGRPLPPLPKEDNPLRSPPQPIRKLSSTCSSYSNVSDNDGPTYANEPRVSGAEWNNGNQQSAYPNSLNKSDTDSGIQMGFQGFPTLPKKGVFNHPFVDRSTTMNRIGGMNSASVCSIPTPVQGMQMPMPQAQSIQGLNYIHPMAGGFVDPYTGWVNPHWVHPNYYPPYYPTPDSLKRTPSNSSMNYACSESGLRLNSYSSMGHLHNPMMPSPFNPLYPSPIPPQHAHRPHSPTHSTRSSRAHSKSMGRRNTTHGFITGRKSQNTSSEDDYYSASDEDELRSSSKMKSESRGWQCEHCTYINAANTRICQVCCKTGGSSGGRSGERRRRRAGGGKTPSSGESISNSRPNSRPNSATQGNEANKTREKTSEELVDEMMKNFVNQVEMNLSLKPDDMKEEVVESKEPEKPSKSEGTEPQTKMTSTGTSPPPQHTGTQTNPINQSDEIINSDDTSRPFYRTTSQSSINDLVPRRTSNINNEHWPNYTRSSRNSLFGGNSRDPSPVRSYRADNELSYRTYPYEPVNRTDYYLNLEELIERRRQETMRSQGFELVRLLREAEQNNFTADDLQVAMNHCGTQNAVQWLQENWKNMVDTVVTLVTNFGKDKKQNDIGVISAQEAKESLRSQKGNVWAAVTDCVEIRQRKFVELKLRGDFNGDEINSVLTTKQGHVEEAYLELCRNWTKPFHMKIWGPPIGVENESGSGFLQQDKPKPTESTLINNWTKTQDSPQGVRELKQPKLPPPNEHSATIKVRTPGSFSGGSYKEQILSSPITTATQSLPKPTFIPPNSNTIKNNDEEDPYVTVQWVSTKKTQPINSPTDNSSIYTTLQELVAHESSSVNTLPKFPLSLDENEADKKKEENVIESGGGSSSNITGEVVVVSSEGNQEVIDAATESILASAQMLIQEEPPKYKNKRNDVERRARMLLAEGRVGSYNEAEIVVMLIDIDFNESDAFLAAKECSDVDAAISFLQQECELCAGRFPMGKMVSMLHCIHRCCQNCAQIYFTTQIRDRNIVEAICPFCTEPDLTDDQIAPDYFNNLDIMLRNLVDEEIHELFQRKVTDRALMKDPNFRWCSQCSSGFIADPFTMRLDCPDCKAVTCAQCRKPWESQHNGITCEQFADWKQANDPDFQAKGLEKHLEENGIDCPSCKFRYSLAKGGCMHFRCMQCKFDFCSGCGRPFKIGPKCNFAPFCAKLGLHAHHPRNCLFYLRDKDPKDLQKLLEQNGIAFDTEPQNLGGTQVGAKCQVLEQKELPNGLRDDICGNEVEEGMAGLCKVHYVEYIVGLICKRSVDPIAIFDVNDLQQELRRWQKQVPQQVGRQSDEDYRNVLCQMIKEQIPLDECSKR